MIRAFLTFCATPASRHIQPKLYVKPETKEHLFIYTFDAPHPPTQVPLQPKGGPTPLGLSAIRPAKGGAAARYLHDVRDEAPKKGGEPNQKPKSLKGVRKLPETWGATYTYTSIFFLNLQPPSACIHTIYMFLLTSNCRAPCTIYISFFLELKLQEPWNKNASRFGVFRFTVARKPKHQKKQKKNTKRRTLVQVTSCM